MILQTAKSYFDEDIQRARDILAHARVLPDGQIKEDVLRGSWMFAVGSLDAYFCDAYGDLLARTFRAKRNQTAVELPSKLKTLKISTLVVLDNQLNDAWLWRNIARDLIEKDNVLSINKIKELFNVFFRKGHKLFTSDGTPLDRWISLQQSKHRIFGFTRTQYRAANGTAKHKLKENALEHLENRFNKIFQRRHDCIHNCDRPKTAIQRKNVSPTYIHDVISDIEYIVNRCHEEFLTEFRIFLRELGFNAVTRNSVGA